LSFWAVVLHILAWFRPCLSQSNISNVLLAAAQKELLGRDWVLDSPVCRVITVSVELESLHLFPVLVTDKVVKKKQMPSVQGAEVPSIKRDYFIYYVLDVQGVIERM
jgi:hypothetical protein